MDILGRMKPGMSFMEERGQDLTEYALLLGFVVTISGALFIVSGNDIRTIWSAGNATLNAARSAAGI